MRGQHIRNIDREDDDDDDDDDNNNNNNNKDVKTICFLSSQT